MQIPKFQATMTSEQKEKLRPLYDKAFGQDANHELEQSGMLFFQQRKEKGFLTQGLRNKSFACAQELKKDLAPVLKWLEGLEEDEEPPKWPLVVWIKSSRTFCFLLEKLGGKYAKRAEQEAPGFQLDIKRPTKNDIIIRAFDRDVDSSGLSV